MNRVWITTGSTRVGPVVNALAAACHAGYRPTDVHVLDNPDIDDVTETATEMIETIVTEHGGAEPTIAVETIENETDFEAIGSFLTDAVADAREHDAEIAIDVTPGRKFWPIVGYQAATTYDAEHCYYVHMDGDYYGECYPTIPRTAIELVDFVEVF